MELSKNPHLQALLAQKKLRPLDGYSEAIVLKPALLDGRIKVRIGDVTPKGTIVGFFMDDSIPVGFTVKIRSSTDQNVPTKIAVYDEARDGQDDALSIHTCYFEGFL